MITRKNFILVAIAMLFSFNTMAQDEYKLYAGFMYHFAKFTQWPAAKQSGDFVIGVVGSSAMAKYGTALAATKKLGSRNIVVKEFSSASSAGECSILFLAKGKTSELSSASSLSKSKNILLVTESPGAAGDGSTINFVQKDGKIRFEMSKGAASAQGLKISSELQKLAIMVN